MVRLNNYASNSVVRLLSREAIIGSASFFASKNAPAPVSDWEFPAAATRPLGHFADLATLALHTAIRHKALQSLHSTALTAQMTHFGIAALGEVPRKQREALAGLPFIEARHIAQHEHPPVVRLALLLAANVAGKRHVPNHGYSL